MKTRFNWIGNDWKRIKNHCRTTVNKKFTENEPSAEFKKKLLISEHSPIRLLEIDWTWENIKSWVSVHWTRHKHEKFVSTQRDDRKEHDISRDDAPQGTPVVMDNYANAQQLIDIFRKRLCYQASPETREYAEDFKMAIREIEPELSDVLVSNCIYRNGCPEFAMCQEKIFAEFLNWVMDKEGSLTKMFKIEERYKLYNEWFYEKHKEDTTCTISTYQE